MKAFDEVSKKIEETVEMAVKLISESGIDTKQIRNRRLRESVEELRKAADSDTVKPETE